MPNPRELSQFGSFIEINDTTKNIGIATSGTPYVGIGTLVPQEKLHVVGNLRVDGGFNLSGVLTASQFAGTANIGIQSGGTRVGVVSTLNFIGAGNTFKYNPSTNTIDISIQSGSAGVSVAGFGAVGNGVADDTSAIQNALNYLSSRGGGFVYLESGKTYKVSTRISVASSCGIIGDGTPILYATAAGFNNTNITSAGRYLSNSVVLDLSGLTSTSYNQILRGFKIESQYQTNRYVTAVTARNCKNLTIESLEIYNFPVGVGIRLASVIGNSKVCNNYIHDFYDDTIYLPLRPQITGIEIDNDRVNSISSDGIDISSNTIENITLSAASIAAHGYETDGINIVGAFSSGSVSKNLTITNNKIKNVGEGIDTFGHRSIIADNTITNTANFAIKMIHGARFNVVRGNTISNTGIAGIVIAATNVTGVGDIEQNIIDGNIITDVDYTGVWGSITGTACIKFDANNVPFTGVPKDNLVSNNILRPGSFGDYNIIVQRYVVNTSLFNNKFVGVGSFGQVFDEREGTTWINGSNDTSVLQIGVGSTISSYIKTGGNLGIGSTAPISELDLKGNYTLNNTTIQNFGIPIQQRSATGRYVLGQNVVRVGVAVSTITVTTRSGIATVNIGDFGLHSLTVK